MVAGEGWDAQRLGTARVDFAYRRIRAEGYGLLATAYGQHRVELQSRVLEPAGAEFMAFGAPWVSYGEQLVAPSGISEDLLNRARQPVLEWMQAAPQTNGFWLDLTSTAQSHPGRFTAFKQRQALAQQITVAELNKLAQQYLQDDSSLMIQVLPAPPEPQQ